MPKGGPLSFLNKKTWHPGRIQNLEEVWKREQAAAQEDAKLKEYQKQLQEERAKDELAAVAEAAGHKIKTDRLDWMYQGGVMARQEADERNEASAAAAAPAMTTAPPGERMPPADGAGALPSFYSEDTPASANEMWQRLHSDPLFAIKQQELSARRSIVANPVKMQQIKQQVKELKQLAGLGGEREKKDRHKEKKEKKKHKKDKKERRHGKRSRHSDGGSDSEGGAAPKRPRSPLPAAQQQLQPQHQHQQRNGHQAYPEPQRQQQQGLTEDRNRQEQRQPDRREPAGDYRQQEGGERGRRERSRSRERERGRRERSRSRERGRHDRSRSRERGRHDRSCSRERAGRRKEPALLREGGGLAGGRPAPDAGPAPSGQRPEVAVHLDAASAQGRAAQYGISYGSGAPQEARVADRSDLAAATRRRLEEAAARREAEEREKAAQRYQRQEYRTGRLTEDEKARRLAEMAGAAVEHEEERWKRLKAQDEKEAAEEAERQGRHHSDTAAFLQEASKGVYGASQGGSLQDTVGRRKFMIERRETGGSAFRKGG